MCRQPPQLSIPLGNLTSGRRGGRSKLPITYCLAVMVVHMPNTLSGTQHPTFMGIPVGHAEDRVMYSTRYVHSNSSVLLIGPPATNYGPGRMIWLSIGLETFTL